jgi:hypothetical protein
LVLSRRFLHLEHDVVRSEEEVAETTYLVTKDWVTKTESDCEKHGDKLGLPASVDSGDASP